MYLSILQRDKIIQKSFSPPFRGDHLGGATWWLLNSIQRYKWKVKSCIQVNSIKKSMKMYFCICSQLVDFYSKWRFIRFKIRYLPCHSLTFQVATSRHDLGECDVTGWLGNTLYSCCCDRVCCCGSILTEHRFREHQPKRLIFTKHLLSHTACPCPRAAFSTVGVSGMATAAKWASTTCPHKWEVGIRKKYGLMH